jgi:hypothetical protein
MSFQYKARQPSNISSSNAHKLGQVFLEQVFHDPSIFENSIILVNRNSPQWMTPTTLRLAGLSAIACSMSIVASRDPKVMLESAVL